MSDETREPPEDSGVSDEAAKEAAEEAVAEAIEEAVAPGGAEEEALLEAADIELLEAGDVVAAPAAAVDDDEELPDDPRLADLARAFVGASFEQVVPLFGPVQDVVSVPREEAAAFAAAARAAGYEMFIDLCGVDYLHRRPRFEVVTNLVSTKYRRRLRIRVGLPADDPVMPSITSVFPGANFYERETWDLFGIWFKGHPDLTRILLPDDWEGHPLRKDYSVGSVPVQFKEAHRAT